MPRSTRRHTRRDGVKASRRHFLVVVEGETELGYFSYLDKLASGSQVKPVKAKHPSPNYLLAKANDMLADDDYFDEVWIVLDRDSWTNEHFALLRDWESDEERRSLALSAPRFELWLLLHFETGKKVDANNLEKKLTTHLPYYNKKNKEIKRVDFPKDRIRKAIERAKRLDVDLDELETPSLGTSVYRLVENILEAETDG